MNRITCMHYNYEGLESSLSLPGRLFYQEDFMENQQTKWKYCACMETWRVLYMYGECCICTESAVYMYGECCIMYRECCIYVWRVLYYVQRVLYMHGECCIMYRECCIYVWRVLYMYGECCICMKSAVYAIMYVWRVVESYYIYMVISLYHHVTNKKLREMILQ